MATAPEVTRSPGEVIGIRRDHKDATPPSKLKVGLRQIFAGGSAGLVEISLMHPLDVIKTRFQIQRGPDDPGRYKSYADCVKKMARNEGMLSFYKGILPPWLAETPKRATKFFTFEQYKGMLSVDGQISAWGLVLAGLGSGITEGIVINPFERVKVSLQAQRSTMAETPSTWAHARHIIKTDGFGRRGLYKGMSGTLYRNGLWNAVYFGFYHNLKRSLGEEPSMGRRLFIGFVAGSLASTINIPFDVAKSRIQGPQPPGQPGKYWGTLRTIVVVFREEGVAALYRGLLPKILRLGPGGGIMLVVYEQVSKWLSEQGF